MIDALYAFTVWFEAVPVPLWLQIVVFYAAWTWALLWLNPRFWDVCAGRLEDEE